METRIIIDQAFIGNFVEGYSKAISQGMIPSTSNIGNLYLQGCRLWVDDKSVGYWTNWGSNANIVVDLKGNIFMVICIK